MDLDALKQKLQGFFKDGLLTIVGSGLSVAEGIAGMEALGEHLQAEIPKKATGASLGQWAAINQRLRAGTGLEAALLEHAPGPELEAAIVELTASLLLNDEMRITSEVLSGKRTLRFTRVLRHVLRPNTGIPVITTNYDRLLELATECAGLGVDTMFIGHHRGVLDRHGSMMSFCRDVRPVRSRQLVRMVFSDRVKLFKPHGSMDWYDAGGGPIRCPLPLPLSRLIITPGLNKFRAGYNQPFDAHRDGANAEVDRATRYLIVGYGFNDDHLETHLAKQLRDGKPALVLTKYLSENAKSLISNCDGVLALSAHMTPGERGVWVTQKNGEDFVSCGDIWDLGVFVQEVLQP